MVKAKISTQRVGLYTVRRREYPTTRNKKIAEKQYAMMKKDGYRPQLWQSGSGWKAIGTKDVKKHKKR